MLQAYANKRMLPYRRLQLQLAQVAMLVAALGGARDVKLSDYLLEPEDEVEASADDLSAAVQFFGFSPRKKKGWDPCP